MPLSPSRIDQALSFAVLAAVIVGCFFVLKPFITALVWAAILCTTTWPLYLRLAARLRHRDGLAAFVMLRDRGRGPLASGDRASLIVE